jgi:hypothetical protein
MAILILDHKQLANLKSYAETHKITLEEGLKIQSKTLPSVGDRAEYRLITFGGQFKIVFSIDETRDHKWIRHMSMSTSTPNSDPHEYALREVSQHLGFKNFDKCILRHDIGNPHAVEVIELV